MKPLVASILLFAAAILSACEKETTTPDGWIVGSGTIQATGGECTGVWLLLEDSGRLYELGDLPAEFQQPGLRVRFTLKTVTDRVSGCMRGIGADVVSMTRI